MSSSAHHFVNVLDAYRTCGGRVSEVVNFYKQTNDDVLARITSITICPTPFCNEDVDSWVAHATRRHGWDLANVPMYCFAFISPRKCWICKTNLLTDELFRRHCAIHCNVETMPFPRTVQGPQIVETLIERFSQDSVEESFVFLRTCLWNYTRQRTAYIYLLFPSWLRGNGIADLLRQRTSKFVVYLRLAAETLNVSEFANFKNFSIHLVKLYSSLLDDDFTGEMCFRNKYAELFLRLVIALARGNSPEFSHIEFHLVNFDFPIYKWFEFIPESTINETVTDMVTNKWTILCDAEFSAEGCRNPICRNMIHVRKIETLTRQHPEVPIEEIEPYPCVGKAIFGIGDIEFESDPAIDAIPHLVSSSISSIKLQVELKKSFFVYVVAYFPYPENPFQVDYKSLFVEKYDSELLSLYVGRSMCSGISPSHTNNPKTEANHDISSGKNKLFIISNPRVERYSKHQWLEAMYIIFGKLQQKREGMWRTIKFMNLHIELVGLELAPGTELYKMLVLFFNGIDIVYKDATNITNDIFNELEYFKPLLLSTATELPGK